MIRALIIFGLLCVYILAQATEPEGAIFPETMYDFGPVKQGSRLAHTFAVRNSTTTPLTIQSVQLSMPAMNARFRPIIAPSSEGTVTIEWDTSHLSGEMDGRATVIFGDSPERTASLLLKAVVKPPLEILPYPAVFLSAFRGEGSERQLRIVNNEEEDSAISLSPADSKHFIASLTTIQPGRVYELVVKIPSAVPLGRYDEQLSLSTNNPKLSSITIPVHVFVKPDLYANPETVDFGAVSAEELRKSPASRELSTQTFLVKKRKGEFAITKLGSNLEALDVRKDRLGKSSTYRVDVALNPEKVKRGKVEGFVEIVTDDKDFPTIRVPVAGNIF